MRNILVTGAAGFIGRNFCAAAIQKGWNVIGVDDMSNGYEEFVSELKFDRFYCCDFSSPLIQHNLKTGVDAVVHLAAIPRVSYSVEHPHETHEVNVNRTLELIEWCKKFSIRRFVFASSSSVYGGIDIAAGPATETLAKNPKSPYALQKSIIEDYLRLYSELYGLDSVSLRFFNVFGPYQLGGTPYSTAVSAWLTALHRGAPLRSDGDGTQSRDMCYVDNVVDACLRALEHVEPLGGVPINVATGCRITNNEILALISNQYGSLPIQHAPPRPGDVKHTLADITRAKEVLGYTPLYSFHAGLMKTVEWYRANWQWIERLPAKR